MSPFVFLSQCDNARLTAKTDSDTFERSMGTMFNKLSGVAIVLSLLIVTPAVKIAARTTPPSAEQEKKGGEQHPHIRAAIRELQEAKRELQTAAHDFGGHRKEALESVDTAIRQLQEALKYDKK
jgi:hypothetical protein